MANRWSSKYSRERKRVTSILRELRKAGYRFNDNIIPAALPRKGRTQEALKAATLELRKMTRSKFYKESTGRVIDTGEILPVKRTAKERRRQTREIRQSQREALSETDMTISNVQSSLKTMIDYSELEYVENTLNSLDISEFKHFRQYQFHNDRVTDALNRLQDIILDEGMGDEVLGREIVADRLSKSAGIIGEIVEQIMYDSDPKEVNYAVARFVSILRGGALSVTESAELDDMMMGMFPVSNY